MYLWVIVFLLQIAWMVCVLCFFIGKYTKESSIKKHRQPAKTKGKIPALWAKIRTKGIKKQSQEC